MTEIEVIEVEVTEIDVVEVDVGAVPGTGGYTGTVVTPALVWVINHPELGFRPAGFQAWNGVTGNQMIPAEIAHPSVAVTVVTWFVAVRGSFILS